MRKRRKRVFSGKYKGLARSQADKYKLLREAGVPQAEASLMKNWSWARIKQILERLRENEKEIF